ncbi:hypothetical protein EJ04DRAFT_504579 [Polyplosphaeria fusca]|uniref:Uncharacterized protein n=1 Tax=Polyplosphaeria fusca TaxID=682080 RepID=A0A9P4QM00_9PLEO|nr:hypothetical protein EJ04DRAFT_504579 [Polyplosphaeria fusca]
MSELNSQFVKRGYWVNRSLEPTMRHTLTTETQTGIIIIALLAVCTTLAMTQLWNLFNFSYYRPRAGVRPAKGFNYQHQALVRPLLRPSSIATDTSKLLFAWKGTALSATARAEAVAHILMAIAIITGPVAAAVFSSSVATSTNVEVLVDNSLCGILDLKEDTSILTSQAYIQRVLTTSEQYVHRCYLPESASPSGCNIFTRPDIPFTARNTTCPFSSELCASPAIAFDTGLLDLNDHFGLNLANEDHVKYRRRTSCAVLDIENRVKVAGASELPPNYLGRAPLPGEQVLIYHVGTRNDDASQRINGTFALSLTTANLTLTYGLLGLTYRPHRPQHNSLDPLKELTRTDADTTLQAVKKGNIMYKEPIEDPVFSAHQATEVFDVATAINVTMYKSDAPLTVLGCTDQVSGLPNDSTFESFPNASKSQAILLKSLMYAANTFGIAHMRSLNASSFLGNTGQIDSLPSDQWIFEAKRWIAIELTAHQIVISDHTARNAVASSLYDRFPATQAARSLCSLQKMRKSGGFININIFRLALILSFNLIVILLEIFLFRFLVYLSRYKKLLSPRINIWVQDSILRLRRRSYETLDESTWRNTNKRVPTLADAEHIRNFQMKDLTSPPSPSMSGQKAVRPIMTDAAQNSLPDVTYSTCRKRPADAADEVAAMERLTQPSCSLFDSVSGSTAASSDTVPHVVQQVPRYQHHDSHRLRPSTWQ